MSTFLTSGLFYTSGRLRESPTISQVRFIYLRLGLRVQVQGRYGTYSRHQNPYDQLETRGLRGRHFTLLYHGRNILTTLLVTDRTPVHKRQE